MSILSVIEIKNDTEETTMSVFDSGDLRKGHDEAYKLRDSLESQPVNLRILRFALRWI